MRRDGGAWIPDGRARSIREDAAASVQALGGVPIDVLLLHAPDPRVSIVAGRSVELALCPHPGGSPTCWCRPPRPALLLAFANRHRIDLRISTLAGASTTDAAMARALGMSLRSVEPS